MLQQVGKVCKSSNRAFEKTDFCSRVLKNPEKGEDKMGRPRKCRPRKHVFSKALQTCTEVLRDAYLLEKNEFPVFVTPITEAEVVKRMKKNGRNRGETEIRYTVKIKTPEMHFGKPEIWLRFNRTGSYVSIFTDGKEEVRIDILKHREIFFRKEITGFQRKEITG
jgi:hypothetical protein